MLAGPDLRQESAPHPEVRPARLRSAYDWASGRPRVADAILQAVAAVRSGKR